MEKEEKSQRSCIDYRGLNYRIGTLFLSPTSGREDLWLPVRQKTQDKHNHKQRNLGVIINDRELFIHYNREM